MKKINAYKEKPVLKKVEVAKKKPQPEVQEVGNRYIHQMFTQEQLLGEAAHTEYYNWLSLKKLISIETEKKDFSRKQKHVMGDKVIFRDRLNKEGNRDVSYELVGVKVQKIEDLSKLWE